MIIDGSFGNPIQGVSQQAPSRRLPNQCTLQENFNSDLLSGLTKRAGFWWLSTIFSGHTIDTKWHMYDRGDGEAYLLAVEKEGKIFAYDLNSGSAIEVDMVAPLAYINSHDPRNEITMETVGDYTMVVNRTVPTKMSSHKTEGEVDFVVIYVRNLTYSMDLEVVINGITVVDPSKDYYGGGGYTVIGGGSMPDGWIQTEQSTTSNGSTQTSGDTSTSTDNTSTDTFVPNGANDNEQVKALDCSSFAADMASAIVGNVGGVDAVAGGNYVVVRSTSVGTKVDCQLKVGGTAGVEDALQKITSVVTDVTQLPRYGYEGLVYEVDNPETTGSAYFRAELKNSEIGTVSSVRYKEVASPDSFDTIEPTSMPHSLIRRFRDTAPYAPYMSYEYIDWDTRDSGDDDSNPVPPFVNEERKVTAIGVMQNRMWFASNENVYFSQTNEFFNLWQDSALTIKDSDPCDVYADTRKLNVIKKAMTHDGSLIYFSENGQFMIDGRTAITPSTVALVPVAEYQALMTADPASSGDAVFFAIDYGNFTGVRELFTSNVTATRKATPVTDHVQRYLFGKPRQMVSSTNIDNLIVLGDDELNKAYVYSWKMAGGEKVQSSWSSWVFSPYIEVLWAGFLQSRCYFVFRDTKEGLVYLEFFDWDDRPEEGEVFNFALDRQLSVKGITKDDEFKYHWVTPVPLDINSTVWYQGKGCPDMGFEVPAKSTNGRDWYATWYSDDFDVDNAVLHGGLTFDAKYTFTNPTIKDRNGNLQGLDRLTMQRLGVHYNYGGELQLIIKRVGFGSEYDTVKVDTGRRVDSPQNRPRVMVNPHTWSPSVRRKTSTLEMQLVTSDGLPTSVREVEWKAEYKKRGRRM